jgi:membrane-bound serine protease (ClpP class)
MLSLGLFFWGHWIVQLAGWEELLLISLGVVLLGLEVFVLPGFGVAGAAGVLALVAGLGLSLVGAGATDVGRDGRSAGWRCRSCWPWAALALLRVLPRCRSAGASCSTPAWTPSDGYVSAPEEDRPLLGQTGRAISPLRPAGIAEIAGAAWTWCPTARSSTRAPPSSDARGRQPDRRARIARGAEQE